MNHKLNWANGSIFINGEDVGKYKKEGPGNLNVKFKDTELMFRNVSNSDGGIEMYCTKNGPIGKIVKERFKGSSQILLNDGREFRLEPKGLFSKKWKLKANDNTLVVFSKGITNKGQAIYIFEDEILILSGMVGIGVQ